MFKDVRFIEGSVEDTTKALFEDTGVSDKFHFTNGTYAAPAEIIVPTTLDGFKYLEVSNIADDDDIFVIAVNSDVSMEGIMQKKNASNAEIEALEDQFIRAMKVAAPLAEANPKRPIYIVFYDEETPTALYESFKKAGLNLETLHKHGYGTDKDAPRIEGAANFKHVIAYPLPNNSKALCHDITVGEDQSHFVKVVDLSKELGGRTVYVAPVSQVGSGAPIPTGFG